LTTEQKLKNLVEKYSELSEENKKLKKALHSGHSYQIVFSIIIVAILVALLGFIFLKFQIRHSKFKIELEKVKNQNQNFNNIQNELYNLDDDQSIKSTNNSTVLLA
jgi:type II secretory pathway component PulF